MCTAGDVHRRVAAHIGDSSSRPNATHEAVGALAAPSPVARLVTTNYDPQLSTVLTERGLAVRKFVAPALPMRDDFVGLVHLHRCVRHEPRHLVVTDRNLAIHASRRYERPKSAVFAQYSVLFVGYSHRDVVMTYLARGLRSGTNRYVLTPDPEAADWRHFSVNPVGYEVVKGAHAALPAALRGWA